MITNEAFTLRSFGGIINYFLRLLPELDNLGAAPVVVAPIHRVPELRQSCHLAKPSLMVPPGLARINTIANTAAFSAEVARTLWNRNHEPVLHRSYFYRDQLQVSVPTVITVYDLIAELFDQRGQEKLVSARARAIESADHIIAISETTKADLIEHFGIDESEVSVTPLASALPMPMPMPTVGESPTRCDPFALYVGNRAGYKNFSALLDAIADPGVPAQLVVRAFGGGRFTDEEWRAVECRGLANRVQHIAAGPDADQVLDTLYRGALAYVCPSRYEGFGLPVLEAMERACPVIAADAGSLPEVAGTAALYFDPNRPSELSAHLVNILENPNVRSHLSLAGPARASSFSWAATAEATLDAYRRTLGASR